MPTIMRMLTSWELALKSERRSTKTIETYNVSVRKLVGYLGDVDVAEVGRDDVRGWLVHLDSEGFSPSTQLIRFTAVKVFFGWLVDEGELDRDPTDRIKRPRVPDTDVMILSEEQARKLVKIDGRDFYDRRDAAILRLFLDTGMRAGALLGLTVDDIDVADRVAHVQTKGDRFIACPFGHVTAKALDDYLRSRERHDQAYKSSLWLGQRGPFTRSGLRQMVTRRGEAAGIDGLHPCVFRHTFAHTWLAEGGQEGDLMYLAGWKSRTMLDRYGRSGKQARARQAHARLALGERI